MSTPSLNDVNQRDLCFIDVETTGSQIGYHEIVDIGVIRASNDAAVVLGEWQRRVRPRHPGRASSYAVSLSGYAEDLWTEAELPAKSLWEEFSTFVNGGVPVCHNPSFDRAFITLAAAEQGVVELGLDYHWIGTESLAWPIYKAGSLPKLSLEALCRLLGVPVEPLPHRAIHGARTCLDVYRILMKKLTTALHPHRSPLQ